MKILVICVLLAHRASGVIYRLNASEYMRLPDLFALDRYHSCLLAPGDTYCYVNAKLVTNETNQLFNVIQEFSAYNRTHYDRTLVHRGICVTQTCRDYLGNSTDLVPTVEACLNASLYKSHGLQTRVLHNKLYCTKYDEPAGYDMVDYAVAVVGLVLLMLNVAGSIFDSFYGADEKSIGGGGRLLLCFSFNRNWRRLRIATGDGPEPRLRRLKCFTGIKTITTIFVIVAHSPLSIAISNIDSELLENMYHNLAMTFIFNGTLLVQSFFLISGFLLAYNLMLAEEKHTIQGTMLPKGILMRWLRLVPANAVVLAFVCTWQRHLGAGPLWKLLVTEETVQCRRHWYYYLFYINNYVDNVDCMSHTWYLAADMQLSILGLMIFCLATSSRARKLAIAAAFLVGVLTPAIHIFAQNLYPIVIVAPEVIRNIFVQDPTFNSLYKRGHTNVVNYAIGMALAMLIYHLQQKKFDVTKLKKYSPIYYALVPLGVLLIFSGNVLYIDGIQFSKAARAVYACAIKPLYGVGTSILIIGAVFKFENLYRGVLEWGAWGPLGRLSYSAFVVHVTIIRTVSGANSALVHVSFNQMVMVFLGVMCLSFMVAVPLWLLVEAPTGELVKILLYSSISKQEEQKPDATMQQVEKQETICIEL